jgi:tRNA/rRNA methyltransferase
MRNFGFRDLRLVAPYGEAFHNARSAAGAADVLRAAQVTETLPAALGDASLVIASSGVEGRSSKHVRRDLPEAAAVIRTQLETKTVAVVFGSEKFGLSNDDLSHCDWVLRIPTDPGCPSMNLGQSVAVVSYELARRAKAAPQLQIPATVSAEVRARIVDMLLPILDQSGFLFPDSPESQIRKVRRFINRLRLAPADARMMQGVLRQVQWRLDHPGE